MRPARPHYTPLRTARSTHCTPQHCLSVFGVSDPTTSLKLIDAKAVHLTVYAKRLNSLAKRAGHFTFIMKVDRGTSVLQRSCSAQCEPAGVCERAVVQWR